MTIESISNKPVILGAISALVTALTTVAANDWLLVLIVLLIGLLYSGFHNLKSKKAKFIIFGSVIGLSIGLIFIIWGPANFYG